MTSTMVAIRLDSERQTSDAFSFNRRNSIQSNPQNAMYDKEGIYPARPKGSRAYLVWAVHQNLKGYMRNKEQNHIIVQS